MDKITLEDGDKFERDELIRMLRNTTDIIGVDANELVGDNGLLIDYSIDIHVDNHQLPIVKIIKEYYLTCDEVLSRNE